ncbi:hypothetical protein TSUD_57480 [Trifolium subterraneum]|uniref:Uncharacterized protein n=1 Tax=Trifolium subterraneum TaxID=3900 RepID=A0A2Z6NKI3_TRISU|nr:hypothetical protein TSUD_57480 [Trifolium subterraneum]
MGKNDNLRKETNKTRKVVEEVTSDEGNNVNMLLLWAMAISWLDRMIKHEDGLMKHFAAHMGTREIFQRWINKTNNYSVVSTW